MGIEYIIYVDIFLLETAEKRSIQPAIKQVPPIGVIAPIKRN